MAQKPEIPNRSIWPILAGLRFFLAFWVLCAHTYNFGLHSRAMPVPSQSGLIAVFCFFAISGFSIHHSISTEPKGYHRRRIARILPTHLAAVGLTFVAYIWFGTMYAGGGTAYPMPDALKWIAYFTLLNLLILPAIMDVLFPLWSLSIEVVYYALAPAIRHRSDRFIFVMILVSGAILVGASLVHGQGAWLAPYGGQAIVFAWAWLAGWLAYSVPRHVGYAFICGLIGCATIWVNPQPFWLTKPSVLCWTYGAWIATIAVLFFPPKPAMPHMIKQILVYLGDLSFPLYLMHYPVLFTVSTAVWQRHPDLNYGWLQAVIALGAAHLVLRYIDRPLGQAISEPIAVFRDRSNAATISS